jgi:hypothetical protein
MGFFLLFLYLLALFLGFVFVAGDSNSRPIKRESTVKFCIEKPVECKKEFDFYQMREEFNSSKENK